jgi:hypothetical protein
MPRVREALVDVLVDDVRLVEHESRSTSTGVVLYIIGSPRLVHEVHVDDLESILLVQHIRRRWLNGSVIPIDVIMPCSPLYGLARRRGASRLAP